ncbi:MAG: YicC family protein [Clostridia bacterium]|nr:YicC family protein [Clostridia bacterium]
MIKSMTAFGRAKRDNGQKSVTVEIKSVNSRFFDCNVKLPRVYSALEERIRSYVQKNAVGRARVEVYLSVENLLGSSSVVSVDLSYAKSYIAAVKQLSEVFGLSDDISAMNVARNPEIFKTEKPDEDMEADWLLIKDALDEAILGFSEMRTAEGAKIEADIKGKIELVREFADKVEEISKSDTVGYRDKLEAKLRQILSDNSVEIDENRLLTECAVWADKIAIDEELVRLRSHFGAFYDIAALPEPSGRKLDFLMQELNRETNTIGSKANNAKIARIVVDMKGELEKIREQVQNIE